MSRRAFPRAPVFPDALPEPVEIETPGADTIEKLAAFLEIDEAATSKAMPVTKPDGTVVLALVRGDDRLYGGEAARGARHGLRAGDGRRDPHGVRRRRRLARAGRLRGRGHRRRGAARPASSSPERTATVGTCAASRPAATTSRASPTFAPRGGRHVPGLRRQADRSRPRSRSATSSSSARTTPFRSARRSSTRTAARTRS